MVKGIYILKYNASVNNTIAPVVTFAQISALSMNANGYILFNKWMGFIKANKMHLCI